MDLSVFVVKPELKGEFSEELRSCINQLKSEDFKKRVISTTVFLNALNNQEYNACKALVSGSIESNLDHISSINYIGQPPANGDKLAIELHLLNNQDVELERVSFAGHSYMRSQSYGVLKGIFVSGIHFSYQNGIEEAYESAYASMASILEKEGLSFNNIVRQWNYIEQILQLVNVEGLSRQNYQVFNDVRSKYYGQVEFEHGYPAATGIGCIAGGVTLSFYALPESSDCTILPVDNPFQEPAFHYPDQVLVGESRAELKAKTTPKFVRAKHIETPAGHLTFISGTAAIRKELTVGQNNMKEQLRITFENIEALISRDNLRQSGVEEASQEKIAFYRGYVKGTAQMDEIERECEALLPGVPYLMLVSDICRNDLLIEIEAYSF